MTQKIKIKIEVSKLLAFVDTRMPTHLPLETLILKDDLQKKVGAGAAPEAESNW